MFRQISFDFDLFSSCMWKYFVPAFVPIFFHHVIIGVILEKCPKVYSLQVGLLGNPQSARYHVLHFSSIFDSLVHLMNCLKLRSPSLSDNKYIALILLQINQ